MALIVTTKDPLKLQTALYDALKAGTVKNWMADSSKDLEYLVAPYHRGGWFRPKRIESATQLRFGFLQKAEGQPDNYAVYHAAFLQVLLTYFSDKFTTIEISAAPVAGLDTMGGGTQAIARPK